MASAMLGIAFVSGMVSSNGKADRQPAMKADVIRIDMKNSPCIVRVQS